MNSFLTKSVLAVIAMSGSAYAQQKNYILPSPTQSPNSPCVVYAFGFVLPDNFNGFDNDMGLLLPKKKVLLALPKSNETYEECGNSVVQAGRLVNSDVSVEANRIPGNAATDTKATDFVITRIEAQYVGAPVYHGVKWLIEEFEKDTTMAAGETYCRVDGAGNIATDSFLALMGRTLTAARTWISLPSGGNNPTYEDCGNSVVQAGAKLETDMVITSKDIVSGIGNIKKPDFREKLHFELDRVEGAFSPGLGSSRDGVNIIETSF